MKKIIISVLSFFIVLACCAYIHQNQAHDMSDTQKGSESSENIGANIPRTIDEINSRFVLIKTRTDNNTNTEHNIYQDEQGVKYIYGKDNGQLKGYHKSNMLTSLIEPIDENQLQNIAENFLKQYVDLEQYAFTGHSYTEDTKIHKYYYYRMINGYKTADFAFVTLNINGEVVGYTAPSINIFDDISVPEIDEIRLTQELEKSMKAKYQYSEYEIVGKIITLNEQKELRMLYNVELTTTDNYMHGDIFYIPISYE